MPNQPQRTAVAPVKKTPAQLAQEHEKVKNMAARTARSHRFLGGIFDALHGQCAAGTFCERAMNELREAEIKEEQKPAGQRRAEQAARDARRDERLAEEAKKGCKLPESDLEKDPIDELKKLLKEEIGDKEEALRTLDDSWGYSIIDQRRIRPEKVARLIMEDNSGQLRRAFNLSVDGMSARDCNELERSLTLTKKIEYKALLDEDGKNKYPLFNEETKNRIVHYRTDKNEGKLTKPEFAEHLIALFGQVDGEAVAAPALPQYSLSSLAAIKSQFTSVGEIPIPVKNEYKQYSPSDVAVHENLRSHNAATLMAKSRGRAPGTVGARDMPDFLLGFAADQDSLSATEYPQPDEWRTDPDADYDDWKLDDDDSERPVDYPLPPIEAEDVSTIASNGIMREADGSAAMFGSKYGTQALQFEKLNQLQAAAGGWAYAARKKAMDDAAEMMREREGEEEPDDFIHASCFIFKRSGVVRRNCTALTQSNFFEGIVLLLILANSVTLAMYDPLVPESNMNQTLNDLGKYFTIAFTIEMMLKIVAHGFVMGDVAYLKSSLWNWLDFVVVVTGYADFIPGYDNKLGVFRTVRLLRPLRTISGIRGMRLLVATLLSEQTLGGVASVCALLLFLITVFGIVGVNIFNGSLRQRCIAADTLKVTEQICTGTACAPAGDSTFFCSRYDPITGIEFENPAYGYVSFDDFGVAVLTIFTMITLEGWTDVMYAAQDGVSEFVWPYFVLLITFGSFISLQLFVAVISDGYVAEQETEDEIKAKREYAKEVRLPIGFLSLLLRDY
eukprot:SAG31_NODE_1029_length_10253_cov_2.979515_2_plen_787_part_00